MRDGCDSPKPGGGGPDSGPGAVGAGEGKGWAGAQCPPKPCQEGPDGAFTPVCKPRHRPALLSILSRGVGGVDRPSRVKTKREAQ